MAGRALFGCLQLPDGSAVVLSSCSWKVYARSQQSCWLSCVSAHCPEIIWTGRSLQACRLCFLRTTVAAAASRSGIFWSCKWLAAANRAPCNFPYCIGRTCFPWRYSKSLWAARVCAGNPARLPWRWASFSLISPCAGWWVNAGQSLLMLWLEYYVASLLYPEYMTVTCETADLWTTAGAHRGR